MKLLSIVALVLFVSANSFAQNGQPAAAEQPAGASASTAPATDAPKMEKKHGAKKKKHGKKHADKAAE